MANFWIPSEYPLARALRGWPSDPRQFPQQATDLRPEWAGETLRHMYVVRDGAFVDLVDKSFRLAVPTGGSEIGEVFKKPAGYTTLHEQTVSNNFGAYDIDAAGYSWNDEGSCSVRVKVNTYANWNLICRLVAGTGAAALGTTDGIQLVTNGSNQIRVYFTGSDSTLNVVDYSLPTGQWATVTWTWSATGTVRLYVNGIYIGESSTLSNTWSDTMNNFQVGWNGSADYEIAYVMMNSKILSDAEIAAFHRNVGDIAAANDTPFIIGVAGGAGTITGTGSLSAQTSSVSGTGVITKTGTSSFVSTASSLDASGTITKTGTGSFQATNSTMSGVGAIGQTGTGDFSAQASSLAGVGEITKTGTGAFNSTNSSMSASGAITRSGTGDFSSAVSQLSATGTITKTGTAAFNSGVSTLDGTGTVVAAGVITGTGDFSSQNSSISGTGVITRTAVGDFIASTAQISGTGVITRVGTGAFAAGVSTLAGVGTLPGTITGTATFVVSTSTLSGVGLYGGWSPISDEETTWTSVTDSSTSWTEI